MSQDMPLPEPRFDPMEILESKPRLLEGVLRGPYGSSMPSAAQTLGCVLFRSAPDRALPLYSWGTLSNGYQSGT
jgi:hypothetical protein